MPIDLNKNNNAPSDEEIQAWVDKLYQYTINQMVNNGVSASQMKTDLVTQGLSQDDAETVVSKVQEMIKQTKKKNGKKDMLYGAL